MIQLTIETPSGGRFEHVVGEGTCILGREQGCGLTIQSPEISRQHLRLTLGEDGFQAEDLNCKRRPKSAAGRRAK